jgi:hypothetical protein
MDPIRPARSVTAFFGQGEELRECARLTLLAAACGALCDALLY